MKRFVRITASLLLGLLAGLALYSVYGSWQIEYEHPPVGRFITVDGVKLHYVDQGSGPAIVLLHGASTSLLDFTASILQPLSRKHRVLAFDRPGYGYSERPDGPWPSPADQARLIHRALEKIRVQRPVVVGHSWSGSVVLAYLLAYPNDTNGGVLLAGGSHPWQGGVDWINYVAGWPLIGDLFSSTLVYPLGELFLDDAIRIVLAPNEVPPDYRERTAAELVLRPATFQANAEDLRELSEFLREQSQHYPEIKQPLLLITGDADQIVPPWNHADRLVKQVPQAELVVLPGIGHALHHVAPQRIVDLIEDFATAPALTSRP